VGFVLPVLEQKEWHRDEDRTDKSQEISQDFKREYELVRGG
jgi:hypothetical protein